MNFDNLKQQAAATQERYAERIKIRERNENLISRKKYLQIDTPERIKKFADRRGFSPQDTEAILTSTSKELPEIKDFSKRELQPNNLERILGISDLIGVAFLEKGLQVARSTGRIWVNIRAGRPAGFGTGFLVSPQLLLTNNHVLENERVAANSQIEFDYQIGLNNQLTTSFLFSFVPATFFLTDPQLDYTLVAIQPVNNNSKSLADFGWNGLIEEEGKFILPQYLNIIQHPNGETKQLSIRENQAIDLLTNFVHYKTDTAPGSSGSPVFNDRWEVVALHHSGVWQTNKAGDILAIDGRIWKPEMGEHRIKWIANEGVRISKILKHIRGRLSTAQQRRLFEEIFVPSPVFERTDKTSTIDVASPKSQAIVNTQDDGTATWTIPLSISIKIGGERPTRSNPDRTLNQAAEPSGMGSAALQPDQPNIGPIEILELAKEQLGKRSDVLNVRLGYVFKEGWITNEKAIVVTVRSKMPMRTLHENNISALPETFEGLPVEVTNPTIEELLQVKQPVLASEFLRRESVSAKEIVYQPPAGVPLDTVKDNMRVVAHLSPDTGWENLRQFIQGTQRKLVIAMFDFGAPHILEEIEGLANNNLQSVKLVIQASESLGGSAKKDDLPDAEVIERLQQAFGNKFDTTYVKTGAVNGWVASSYHIKVAVRDKKAIWLSSGNWQSSNLPNAFPFRNDARNRFWLNNFNREWHAIVEHPGLAGIFEKYILHDLTENKRLLPEEALMFPDVLLPELIFTPTAAERTKPFNYFDAFDDTRQFEVTPLLTPDNYLDEVIKLIEEAEEELLIQNQTFNPPGDDTEALNTVLEAVLNKQRAGVEVRIIFRGFHGPTDRKKVSGLVDMGFKKESIKAQKNCHTKGIIVDRRKVLVGSQNISNQGVSVNRDASLLFHDTALANYFADIFEHDWKNLAEHKIASEEVHFELIDRMEKTPAGTVRLSWKELLEML